MVWLDPNKTKAWRKEYNPKYYQANREILRKKQKEYYEKTKQMHSERRKRNYDPIKRKERTIREREKSSLLGKLWRLKNKEHIENYRKQFERTPERIAYHKEWNRKNPKRSKGSTYPLELEIAMNNVRMRDNNTCQWQGCGLSFKNGYPIHVHHIFPRNEYPELQLIEQYMLCYCWNHHYMWHKYRGDSYTRILKPRNLENLRIKHE